MEWDVRVRAELNRASLFLVEVQRLLLVQGLKRKTKLLSSNVILVLTEMKSY